MPGGEVHKTFKIFCGNLAGAATKDDLYYLFSQYGPVIEAVVMVGKFYGFVHMAYEEDGWKAICELRGYFLHGKAMAVEASINAKKAAPVFKQNIIGKGITTLDDFNDFSTSKSKALESRERHHRPEHFPSFKQQPETSPNLPTPSGLFSYPPPFPTSVSSSQPSPIGQTPPPMSRASPMPDFQPMKTYETIKERQSPLAKMQAVDANSNPIQESNNERMQKNSAALCNLCGATYDEWQHKPKILSCGHTFCCDCLMSIALDIEVKCPVGCPYTTALTEAGISGLTTNYTVPIKKLIGSNISPSLPILAHSYGQQNGAQRPGNSPSHMVCCTCPKIVANDLCSSQNHQLIPEDQARDILRGHLQSSQEITFKQLRRTMTMRATVKERLERTVLSVEKFLEELRRKVEGEQLEEAVLQEHLADLTVASEALSESTSISQLIESLQKVHSYSSIISTQFNQCAAITAINNATEAIVIKLKQSALDGVLTTIGFRNEEAFAMTSSLEEHALFGNNANVLLLYMLSDLLSTRMMQLSTVSPVSPLSPSQQPPLSASSPLQANMTPSVASTNILEESLGHGLGLTPGKLNEMKSYEVSKLNEMKSHEMSNINEHILQMTEAIEAGSLLSTNDGMSVMSAGATGIGPNSVSSALSLGLTNLSLLASEPSENGKDEIESLTDKKEPLPVSYVDAAKRPAKPTPPPENPPKMPVPKPIAPLVRPGKFPHCWMVLSINGVIAGRILFELRPDKAPRMCDNFVALCTGRSGYGYKGTHFFKSGEGFLAGGDVENDDGTGGYSAFDKNTFEADLCPLKDEVGMVRFKGIGTSDNGRGMIGSQFMIWCGDREFKKFSYSLVFGKVVDGLDVAKKAAAINVHRVSVKVEQCGAI
ncbi:uncharacterized protein LOC121861490 isoform X2 [Homarus americanus]|uniref:Cyclophilin E n=2 Tax=Homarus americanus TaxID=6706 RepID=A0A8J5TKR1_HOMAM|nr:uncharacterized protein LOC121861490 isoform X2 [Homarus americanus]XP_042215234.1 uncharacterized protein LOC121861490 isoform X2 [Homarus americanus]XP_042215240.1 uncharacterized protein LOC121861490 isoform X2 [Homarus americanus]KAG7177614.1 Peptidyl-prolyl cis-trans isomerase CYPA-like 3 [Homarus americanus]